MVPSTKALRTWIGRPLAGCAVEKYDATCSGISQFLAFGHGQSGKIVMRSSLRQLAHAPPQLCRSIPQQSGSRPDLHLQLGCRRLSVPSTPCLDPTLTMAFSVVHAILQTALVCSSGHGLTHQKPLAGTSFQTHHTANDQNIQRQGCIRYYECRCPSGHLYMS